MSSSSASVKRTDLDDLVVVVVDFFWAALKSEARDGSLGVVRVADDEDDEALAEWSNCALSSAS